MCHPALVETRPAVVSVAFLTLALVHAWWGVKMLLASNTFMGGAQFVSAGAFLLAAASARERSTFTFALMIAAAATGVRVFAMLPPGPFFYATALLAGGFALTAWGLRRLDGPTAGWEAIPIRGGLAMAGVAYLAFLGAGFALGNPPGIGSVDFLARALAGFAAAAFIDAPALQLGRKPFAADAASAAR